MNGLDGDTPGPGGSSVKFYFKKYYILSVLNRIYTGSRYEPHALLIYYKKRGSYWQARPFKISNFYRFSKYTGNCTYINLYQILLISVRLTVVYPAPTSRQTDHQRLHLYFLKITVSPMSTAAAGYPKSYRI